jgi:hypothetical protein
LDWCSGSVAVLFSVILGYNDLQLIGFDLNYQEFLPETEQLPDGSLRITKTPEYNPNYFIDDYQQEGDHYNLPNLERVHKPSWEHATFIITGYVHLNRIPMMIHAFTKDDVVGLTRYFPKKNIDDYFVEDLEPQEEIETITETI